MTAPNDAELLRTRLQELKVEHRDLDAAIEHLGETLTGDDLMLRRLKKRKLHIKDRIVLIEAMLNQDILA